MKFRVPPWLILSTADRSPNPGKSDPSPEIIRPKPQRLHNSLNIAGHFQACPGPVFCHEGRGPVAPATGTALDIGDDQNALKPSVQYLVPSMRILARLFLNLVCFRIFYLTAEVAETAEGTIFINIYYFSVFSISLRSRRTLR